LALTALSLTPCHPPSASVLSLSPFRLVSSRYREGAPLGRNQYVELEIKKQKENGTSTKLPANQKPCDKMAEAIVMDGGKRGQVV
jgi:hypothetical protein